jgi:hypothetical protein
MSQGLGAMQNSTDLRLPLPPPLLRYNKRNLF